MESVFDHNVTKDELELLFGTRNMTRERLDGLTNQEDNYAYLYRLYLLRKNREMATKYLSMIPDSEWKVFTLIQHDFAKF